MRHVICLALGALVCGPALAVGRLADVSVVDRDTGQVLQAHAFRGEYWVAGRPGARYAIQVRNQQGGRLLAVTSVDGINVLSGETAAVDQRGYVFSPWQGYDIAGWRKSDAQIAAFTFTAIPRSYAARTGRPDNVGVIGVALFREQPPLYTVQEVAPLPAPPSPPLPPADRAAEGRARESAKASAERSAPAAAPSLGTGHGPRETSRVTQVEFLRAQSSPDEVIRIRYDSEANLLAMGVIRAPRPQPRGVDPFPDSPKLGYVPDP